MIKVTKLNGFKLNNCVSTYKIMFLCLITNYLSKSIM